MLGNEVMSKEQLYDLYQQILGVKKFEHQLLYNAMQVQFVTFKNDVLKLLKMVVHRVSKNEMAQIFQIISVKRAILLVIFFGKDTKIIYIKRN